MRLELRNTAFTFSACAAPGAHQPVYGVRRRAAVGLTAPHAMPRSAGGQGSRAKRAGAARARCVGARRVEQGGPVAVQGQGWRRPAAARRAASRGDDREGPSAGAPCVMPCVLRALLRASARVCGAPLLQARADLRQRVSPGRRSGGRSRRIRLCGGCARAQAPDLALRIAQAALGGQRALRSGRRARIRLVQARLRPSGLQSSWGAATCSSMPARQACSVRDRSTILGALQAGAPCQQRAERGGSRARRRPRPGRLVAPMLAALLPIARMLTGRPAARLQAAGMAPSPLSSALMMNKWLAGPEAAEQAWQPSDSVGFAR